MNERGGKIEDKIEGHAPAHSLVIIGTRGSIDYLKDTTGDRYWPVVASSVDARRALSPEDRAVVQPLVELTGGAGGMRIGKKSCCGLHDPAPVINAQDASLGIGVELCRS